MSDPLSKFIVASAVVESPASARLPVRPGQTPGQMIREARDHARINLEELANSLRLPLATLEALEQDDFATLSQPVYVRGYYRRCARMLGLDESDLLQAYEALVPANRAPPPQRYALGEDEPGTRWPFRGILLALAIVAVLVLAVMMWMRHAETVSSLQGSANEVAPAASESAAVDSAAGATAPPPRATVYDALAKAEPAATDKAVLANRVPGTTRPAPASSAATATAADSRMLTLIVRSTSWVRIEDGAGKLLYAGTIQGGSRQDLSGRPPYQLFIGNAAGVDIQYGGVVVDIKPFIRDNATARVTVPLTDPTLASPPQN